jgi:DNA-binding transcriptional MocR family regulator
MKGKHDLARRPSPLRANRGEDREAHPFGRDAPGFVLWIELPAKVSALELHERALAQKISIAPGPMFSAKRDFQNFIRINCGHAWTSRLEQAVGALGRIVRKMA